MKDKIINYLLQISEKVNEHSKIYKEGKDALIYANALELLSDISEGIKLIHTIGKTFDIIKFKMFLRGLGNGEIREKDIKKLVSYIDNSSKVELIAQTFKKIVMSRSKKSCCILGLLYSEVVSKDNEISYDRLVIYNALDELNDIDIAVFYELFGSFEKRKI